MDNSTVIVSKEMLEKLAMVIGTTVDKALPWIVKQQYIYSIKAWLFFIIMNVILFFYIKFLRKHWKVDAEHRDNTYSIYHNDDEGIFFMINICIAILYVSQSRS